MFRYCFPTVHAGAKAGLSRTEGVGVACSVFVLAVALIAVITVMLLLIVVRVARHRSTRGRSSRKLDFKISPINPLFRNKKTSFFSPTSPAVVADLNGDSVLVSDRGEFSRSNLELHQQIGG